MRGFHRRFSVSREPVRRNAPAVAPAGRCRSAACGVPRRSAARGWRSRSALRLALTLRLSIVHVYVLRFTFYESRFCALPFALCPLRVTLARRQPERQPDGDVLQADRLPAEVSLEARAERFRREVVVEEIEGGAGETAGEERFGKGNPAEQA